MKHILTLALSALLPMHVLALDFIDRSGAYADGSSFTLAESAGISVLTELGAVQGNPDGTFMPGRTLNRAEFLKIVLLSFPESLVNIGDSDNCFPDVRTDVWYSPFVCSAKNLGIVSGYPDGMFRPENPVNYAEALKILSELFGYALPEPPANERWAWYRAYYLAAEQHDVLLPMDLEMDAALLRGQMARLAAAYRAESDGELIEYRMTERGEEIPEEEESSSSSSVSSEASSSSSSVSSEPEQVPIAATTTADFPAVSRFLQIGKRSRPVASGVFTSPNGDARVRFVRVELEREIIGLQSFSLVDANGNDLAVLKLDLFDKDDETWIAELPVDTTATVTDEGTVLGLVATMKPQDAGADVLVSIKSFRVSVEMVAGGSAELLPTSAYMPRHQTTRGTISSVQDLSRVEGALTSTSAVLTSVAIGGTSVDGGVITLKELDFTVTATTGVTVSNWILRERDSNLSHSCVVSSGTVTCIDMPSGMADVTDRERTFDLRGTVSVTGENRSLQVGLGSAGTLGEFGAIQWSDGTGRYTWTEFTGVLAPGTEWKN